VNRTASRRRPPAASRPARLSADDRTRDLDALSHGPPLDLLVVGGGITGAGIALDAALRGLSVALIERHDLAYGTSRWSSKLVHGGLRYLASGQLGIAYESARERDVLMRRVAPHLVRPLPFVTPIAGALTLPKAGFVEAGLVVAEGLRRAAGTSSRVLPRHRHLSARAARAWQPRIGPTPGAFLNWDGQLCDDARLVIAVARTAAAHGARVLTRVEALAADADGAQVRDTLTGGCLRVAARDVVVATGVSAGDLAPSVRLRPSRGTHLLLRAEALGHPRAGLNVLVPGSATRWVFMLPQAASPRQNGTVLVGLTDEPIDGPPPEVPRPGPDDEAHLLEVLNSVLDRAVQPGDVVGRFAGLRPLIDTGRASTADLSRRHLCLRDPATGVLAMVGGKLTTYRAMAEQAVDAVLLRRRQRVDCRTRTLPLVGAAPKATLQRLAAPAALVARYGTEAVDVLDLAAGRPGLAEPVFPGCSVLRAELAWGIQREGALSAEDLIERRTRLSLIDGFAEAALPVAETMLAEERTGSVAG
jgi:glycerol-3-phosphate dehydrogenase